MCCNNNIPAHGHHHHLTQILLGCALCGVLCIALPIPIIVNNFNKFYEKSKIEEEIVLKKNQSSWEEGKRGKMYF